MANNIFNELNTINVSDYVEKKNGLNYLSWSYAWQELKRRYPESTYKIYENNEGMNYHTDGKTCWVKTGVTLIWFEKDGQTFATKIEGAEMRYLEHIEYLPIMNNRNQSIPVENITSMDVNKAIQRSLTKAIARHGLGLYVYAGEDLPEEDPNTKAEREAKLHSLHANIDELTRKLTKSMKSDEKKAFFGEHIVSIIKMQNYNRCEEIEPLEALYAHLKALAQNQEAA